MTTTVEEIKVVRGEIARTDTKASILLASVAIVAGPLAEQATVILRQPWPVQAFAAVAAVLLGVATWLLLDVVLPRLTGRSNNNFLHYARCDRDTLRAALGDADQEGELIVLSGIADAKFRCLARAGVLLKAGGLLFAAAFVLARIL
ncbi:Pycsar system effector family protein [Streptomyces mirabilis]|uniref:Pycsar system effector family protein n=1 Tax=Streptomyces mirabilis TaxID=68239 RepID=UPI0033F37910